MSDLRRLTSSRSRRGHALLAAVAVAVAFAACGILDPEIQDSGKIREIDIEGGCWVIDTDETTYLPLNLPANMRVDGLPVSFEGNPRPEVATFCPGAVIELLFIEAVTGGGEE